MIDRFILSDTRLRLNGIKELIISLLISRHQSILWKQRITRFKVIINTYLATDEYIALHIYENRAKRDSRSNLFDRMDMYVVKR